MKTIIGVYIMARTSQWNWENVQVIIQANMTAKGLTSKDIYCLVVPDESKRTKENYSSFQVGLSNALRDGKLTGFETKKGVGGGLFRAGEVPKSEKGSDFPSFPTKTIKVGGVEMKIKAGGVSLKHNGATFSKLSHADGFRKAAELLVLDGAEEARSLEDLVALVEDNMSKVQAALSSLTAE
jgi:hypothetical protein